MECGEHNSPFFQKVDEIMSTLEKALISQIGSLYSLDLYVYSCYSLHVLCYCFTANISELESHKKLASCFESIPSDERHEQAYTTWLNETTKECKLASLPELKRSLLSVLRSLKVRTCTCSITYRIRSCKPPGVA